MKITRGAIVIKKNIIILVVLLILVINLNVKADNSKLLLEIETESSWRGVYSNNYGTKKIEGQGNFSVEIKNQGAIVITIQNLNNKQLKMALIKNKKVIDKKSIKNKYMDNSIFYNSSKGFNIVKLESNRLNPSNDEDGDEEYRLMNYLDPLPQSFGNVTEAEYKELLRTWSEKMIKTIDESINIVKEFKNDEISVSNYFYELGSFSEFANNPKDSGYIKVVNQINNTIPPKKYMNNEYYWKAINKTGIVYDNFLSGDSKYDDGYKIKNEYFDAIINNLERSYNLTGIEKVKMLKQKVVIFKNFIPNKP